MGYRESAGRIAFGAHASKKRGAFRLNTSHVAPRISLLQVAVRIRNSKAALVLSAGSSQAAGGL
jgi:hypothetical protein